MKTRARVYSIGGGGVGASVAYHLAKLGWSDVVLLERADTGPKRAHMRGFQHHATAGVQVKNISNNQTGFHIAGP